MTIRSTLLGVIREAQDRWFSSKMADRRVLEEEVIKTLDRQFTAMIRQSLTDRTNSFATNGEINSIFRALARAWFEKARNELSLSGTEHAEIMQEYRKAYAQSLMFEARRAGEQAAKEDYARLLKEFENPARRLIRLDEEGS